MWNNGYEQSLLCKQRKLMLKTSLQYVGQVRLSKSISNNNCCIGNRNLKSILKYLHWHVYKCNIMHMRKPSDVHNL